MSKFAAPACRTPHALIVDQPQPQPTEILWFHMVLHIMTHVHVVLEFTTQLFCQKTNHWNFGKTLYVFTCRVQLISTHKIQRAKPLEHICLLWCCILAQAAGGHNEAVLLNKNLKNILVVMSAFSRSFEKQLSVTEVCLHSTWKQNPSAAIVAHSIISSYLLVIVSQHCATNLSGRNY